MVLSACSTYFDSIFSEYAEKNPIVILKDVKYMDMKSLVNFMYRGEINVQNVSIYCSSFLFLNYELTVFFFITSFA